MCAHSGDGAVWAGPGRAAAAAAGREEEGCTRLRLRWRQRQRQRLLQLPQPRRLLPSPSPPLGVAFPRAQPRRPVDGWRVLRTEDPGFGSRFGLDFLGKGERECLEGRPPEEVGRVPGKGRERRYGLVKVKEINF